MSLSIDAFWRRSWPRFFSPSFLRAEERESGAGGSLAYACQPIINAAMRALAGEEPQQGPNSTVPALTQSRLL